MGGMLVSRHPLRDSFDSNRIRNGYQTAVRDNVRSFQDAMEARTRSVLQSFRYPVGQSESFPNLERPNGSRSIENQSLILSFESLKTFTALTLELCHGVTDIILSLREDTWNNDALFLLAKECHGIIVAQLEFYEEAEDSIKRAKDDAQSFLETALKSVPVDRERADAYLRKFLEAEEPCGKEFREKLWAVWGRHELMMQKLKEQEKKLKKKLRRNRVWADVSSVLLIALTKTVLICAIVAAAAAGPPVAAAALAAIPGLVSVDSMGTWVQSLWENRRQEIERELERVRNCTRADTMGRVSVHELQSIKLRLAQSQFAAIVSRANIGCGGGQMTGRNCDDTRRALDDVRRDKDQFVSTLDDLHEHIQKIKNDSKRESQRIIGMLNVR